MKETRDVIFGIDFGREASQITFYDRKAQEPTSLEEVVGSKEYEIPTAVCVRHGRKGFHVGSEAKFFSSQNQGILLSDLYILAESDKDEVLVGGERMPLSGILAGFFQGLLGLSGLTNPVRNTRCIAVAVPVLTPALVKNITAACEEMGFGREEYFLLDYAQAFFYYAMTSRRENWNRNIGWYEFSGSIVRFRRLSVQSGKPPITIRLAMQGERELSQEQTKWDDELTLFVKETLSTELYSTILLTGKSFFQEWAVRSIPVLCQQQRKVFYGNNLFSKGACAAAKERKEDNNLKGYRFFSDNMVLDNVGMEMRIMGAPTYYSLIDAGKNWYEYHVRVEMILDQMTELVFVISSAGSQEKKKVAMKLEDLPERPERTTRLLLEMSYLNRDDCSIKVTDLGFGEMFPSSQKVWTEVVQWQSAQSQES